ncbi:endolytic transglycosylase MltG [Bacillus thuringiensis]|uniref:Endolytic murein transglycosylase n=1 Tax=Bacillus thuringiensis TaxID=1428 RepID=A0A9X6WN74_BACTU|nr:endolytic transglycosylase MltG [Bacillus thuringiensis]PFJ38774.1 hypothetical protein COJ15_17000 [Bacillus thuringiensis]
MEENQFVSKPKKKRTLLRVLGIIIGILLVLGLSLGFYVFKCLQPYTNVKKEIVVDIPMNSSLKTISEVLEKDGVIRNSKVFYYYARYHKETDLRAGKYQLSSDMELDEIIGKIKEGKTMEDKSKFTIPEGYTTRQIADLLEKKGLTTKKEFMKAVNYGKYPEIWYLKHVPNKPLVKYKLEGFLFPKTYTVKEGATAEEIVKVMLEQTAEEFPKEWINELAKNHISFYDAMIVASIVEREAASDNERSRIAGVYYNRLKKGMKLQADATIQYVMDKQKSRLLYKDLKLNTQYNTYMYKGLPPGPIANSGIASIKAAVFPEKHDYLYYVTKKDGSGEHYFSKTYELHEHNIRLSKQNPK